jgi:hypothetical protein
MAINGLLLKSAWVHQDGKKNCGSCCVGSIINYANRTKGGKGAGNLMTNKDYTGLFMPGVHNFGSVTARLAQAVRESWPTHIRVEEVLVNGHDRHWGGLVNSNFVSGGAATKPKITADATFFATTHRFLLRECSAYKIAGHFVIQTSPDAFWDPLEESRNLPMTLQELLQSFNWIGNTSALSLRADACVFDII